MIKFIGIGFCLLLLKPAQSQVEQIARLEIPINHEFQSYQVCSLDTAGVLSYRRFSSSKGDQFELMRLDKDLQVVWKGYLPVARGLILSFVKAHANNIYFFLKQAIGKPDFQVLSVKISNGSYQSYEIKNLIPFNPSEFVVTRKALLIGGYFNYRPIVIHFSLVSHNSRVLPGFLNEKGELTQIYANADGNVDVIISAKGNSSNKSLWIRTYDSEASLIKTVLLEPSKNKGLLFGRSAKANKDTLIIAGVYGRNTEFSRGIFIANVNPYGEYIIHYYNFADLKNFFQYMKPKREKRVKERIERRKMKGKTNKYNYRFLVHQLIPYQDKFIMVGEAFLPHYATRRSGNTFSGNTLPGYSYSPYSYAPSSRSFTPFRNDLVFDGFEYTHAIVLGIDAKGKLIWDNSFRISDIRSFQLEQFVKIAPRGDQLLLLYLNQNSIMSKIIEGNKVIEGNAKSTIKVKDGTQLIESSGGTSKLEYWYPNHLYIYGTQTIRGNNESSQLVFYINKLEVK